VAGQKRFGLQLLGGELRELGPGEVVVVQEAVAGDAIQAVQLEVLLEAGVLGYRQDSENRRGDEGTNTAGN
jgi:hypothetical protein